MPEYVLCHLSALRSASKEHQSLAKRTSSVTFKHPVVDSIEGYDVEEGNKQKELK